MSKSMNVLIDTNVVLDVLLDREPHAEASTAVLRPCEAGCLNGSLAALSVANLAYIMRKQRLTTSRVDTAPKQGKVQIRDTRQAKKETL